MRLKVTDDKPSYVLIEVRRNFWSGKIYRVMTGLEEGQQSDELLPYRHRRSELMEPQSRRYICIAARGLVDHDHAIRLLDLDPTLDRDIAQAKVGRGEPVEMLHARAHKGEKQFFLTRWERYWPQREPEPRGDSRDSVQSDRGETRRQDEAPDAKRRQVGDQVRARATEQSQ